MPRAARVMPATMSGPVRTRSKGNKPWSSGSDNRGLLFEFWLAVILAIERETDHPLLANFLDRPRLGAWGTCNHWSHGDRLDSEASGMESFRSAVVVSCRSISCAVSGVWFISASAGHALRWRFPRVLPC